MHLCMNEILILSMLLNVFQAGMWVHARHLIKEARRVARILRRRLLDRPQRVIVYADGVKYDDKTGSGFPVVSTDAN